MAYKFFTMSFDDGLEQDKHIIEILRRYDLQATFNLNAGLFGSNNMIGRIGNYGVRCVKEAKDSFWMKYSCSNRIPENEIRQVYQGFEIASHSFKHENFRKADAMTIEGSLRKDVAKLTELAGYKIAGHAYPSGFISDEAVAFLKKLDVEYGRGICSTHKFEFPEEPLRYQPTVWIIENNLLDLADRFLRSESEQDQLFYVWGHGYELDFGTKRCNWYHFEKFCERMAGRNDIIYCDNKTAFRMHQKEIYGKCISGNV